MASANLRSTFGHGAGSLESVRASVGVPRPVSVRQLCELYVREVVFDEPIVTADGVALGGRHKLTVRRDGSWRYQGHFRATGFPSFDVSILTTLGYEISVPGGGPPAGAQVAFAARGRVHGTNEAGDREHAWDQSGVSPLLASEWHGVRQARLNRHLQFDTDWFGPAGDVVGFLAQVVGFGAVLGATGVAVVLLGEAADLLDLEQTVLPGTVGLLLAGGAGFVFGPGLMIPAFIAGTAVTAALVGQRPLTDAERAFADQVFHGRVPMDRVLLTNVLGLGERPFTCPAPGGAILVNMGLGFDDPVRYTGHGRTPAGKSAPGQLLIHELTHAWQIANESFTPEFYCRAVTTASGTLDRDFSAYGYGPATGGWGELGTEQQASIVEDWFAGNTTGEPSLQSAYPPMSEDDQNPYFRYIRDNIRAGIA